MIVFLRLVKYVREKHTTFEEGIIFDIQILQISQEKHVCLGVVLSKV